MSDLGLICSCPVSDATVRALRDYIVAREQVKFCTLLSNQALRDRVEHSRANVMQTASDIAYKDASELADHYFSVVTEINKLAWDRIDAGQNVALKFRAWREELLKDHQSINAQGGGFCGIRIPPEVPESLRLEKRLRLSEEAWVLHDSSLQSLALANRLREAEAQLDDEIEASYRQRQAEAEYKYEGSVISDETYRGI